MKLGIDFGTCFSFTAACFDGGTPKPLIGDNCDVCDGQSGIPTVFFSHLQWGEVMGNRALILQENVSIHNGVVGIKRDLCDKCQPDRVYTLGDSHYTARDIVVRFIKFLIDNAVKETQEYYTASSSPPETIVITVPAASGTSYRSFIRDCVAEASGLNIEEIKLIEEPVAAALTYYRTRTIADGSHILVCDLGGGTLDAAVVEYNLAKNPNFIVKSLIVLSNLLLASEYTRVSRKRTEFILTI